MEQTKWLRVGDLVPGKGWHISLKRAAPAVDGAASDIRGREGCYSLLTQNLPKTCTNTGFLLTQQPATSRCHSM